MNTIDYISDLYTKCGKNEYFGEQVTQYQHAAQCAMLAETENADLEMQVAAFLHDIGHLLPNLHPHKSEFGHTEHDKLAVSWLENNGFSKRIQTAVGGHVNAKRYLCATNPLYYNELSEASKQTLALQGGIMHKTEIEAMQQNPYFDDIIQLRIWDDKAKNPTKQSPHLEYFVNKIAKYLAKSQH